MMKRPLLVAALLALAACGNSPDASESKASAKTFAQLVKVVGGMFQKAPAAPDPAALAALRTVLEKDGQPIYAVSVATLSYANLMAPYGQNGDVTTWASTSYETISLRDGMLVATRGFGPDLMSASAPPMAQIRRGTGQFHRVYYYLDGADQRQAYGYDCQFAASGSAEVTVLAKTYQTRAVTEICKGQGATVENRYWFDGSGILRQSDQFMAPGLAAMRLQRVID